MGNAKRFSATTNENDESVFTQNICCEVPVNIKFSDLSYRVKEGKKIKTILNGISGEFRAGELSVIIGPSGSGKTSLLNLLAGYGLYTAEGNFTINGNPRNMKRFRQMSRYILQDDDILPCFTVWETMMFATNLKLDSRCSREQRVALIYEILEIFHLRQQADTLIASASGGELKRVRIALEMINNPSVLLLDEPVTGLDEFSAAQCLGLLKHLADCGRTVICSLHAPSARLSQLFNKIYAISSGECIYQGPVKYIVPFLKEFSLNCPITHNPVDFLIDVSIKTFGDFQYEMVEEIRNGKIASWFPKSAYANHRDFPNRNKFKMFDILENSRLMLNESSAYERSWWLEFRFILIRCLQQMWREKANVNLRLSAPILCSIVVGLAYYNVFRNSEHSLFTFLLPVTFTTEIVFLAMAPMVANVPQMIKFMRTEYFNQWYRLSSYYMAFLTAQLPYLFFMSIVCSVLIYFITGQPMELRRFILFAAITTLISLASSSYGLLVGSSFGIMHALFIGPMYTGIMLLFSYLSFGGADLSLFHKILMYSNFMRHALEGMLVPLFCLDRPDFPDPYDGAKFAITKPKYILKMFGSLNISYIRSVLVLGATTVVLCMLAFSILKYRLNVKRNSKSL